MRRDEGILRWRIFLYSGSKYGQLPRILSYPIPGLGSFSNEERVQAWECVELLPNSVLAHVWLDEVLVLQSLVNDWGLHEEY